MYPIIKGKAEKQKQTHCTWTEAQIYWEMKSISQSEF